MLTLNDQIFGTLEGTATFFLRPMRAMLAKGDAKKWILANLRPSTQPCPLSESGLKGIWETTTPKHSLHDSEFLAVLVECDLVIDGKVYAEFSDS
jgi:hypothetical protein